MRTTLNLDDDVLDAARALANKLETPFRAVVNEALREGLRTVEAAAASRPYRTRAHAMGLRESYDLDNIQELLTRIEGKDSR